MVRRNRNQVEDSPEEGAPVPEVVASGIEAEEETSSDGDDGDGDDGDGDDSDDSFVSSESPTANVVRPLTGEERLRLVEGKVDAIGAALHSLATHTKGHLLDAFISDWEKFTAPGTRIVDPSTGG